MRHELTLVTTDDIEKAIDTPPTTDVNPSAREPRGLAGLDALLSYVSKTCALTSIHPPPPEKHRASIQRSGSRHILTDGSGLRAERQWVHRP